MPSEPRTPIEPTFEELSALIDRELDAEAQARVEDHVKGCADCQARLEGLRQTAYAIRALPMETPPRTITIPAQRRQYLTWAPVAWLGGAAAALLVLVFGFTQLHFNGPSATTASFSSGGGAAAVNQAAPQLRANDRITPATAAKSSYANATTVTDPRQPSRALTLAADASAYPASGTMTVQVRISGVTASQVTTVRLFIERNGYAVELPTPAQGQPASAGFQASYALQSLALSNPAAGSYTLIAIEPLPGGDGGTLVARLPITIQ